jgi:transposase
MTPEREAQIIAHLNTGASWQSTTRTFRMGDATFRRYATRWAEQGLIPDRRLSTAVQRKEANYAAIAALHAAEPTLTTREIGQRLGLETGYVGAVLRLQRPATADAATERLTEWQALIDGVHPRAKRRMRIAFLRERWKELSHE